MKKSILAVLLAATALAGADAGEFLLDLEVVYATAQSMQQWPAAASDGANSLVVWSDARSGTRDIYGARFAPAGIVRDQAGLAISTADGVQTNPAVACDGTNYLVVWADQREDTSDIYATRVTPGGYVLDPTGIAVSTATGFQGVPAVAFDGTNYLVVWTDLRNGDSDIYGARVTRNGVVVDTSGLALAAVADEQTAPAVVYDGTNVLLVWEDTRDDVFGDVYGARVSAAGAVLDSTGFPISCATDWQGSPAVAPGDNEVLVVWHDMRAGYYADVYGARVTRAGQVLDPDGLGISVRNDYQWYPQVAFDGTNYLVVWTDEGGHGDIWGGRVEPDGSVLDPHGFLIRGGGEDQSSPAVTFDGTYHTVVWDDSRTGAMDLNVYGTRINRDGIVLDPQSIPVSTAAIAQDRPAAAFEGTEFLVVWDEAHDNGRDVRGVRLTSGGVVLDTSGIRVSPPGGDQSLPAVAHGASVFLVVWEEGMNRDRDVRGVRVNSAGRVLDSASILIAGRAWEQCAPAAASDGDNFLVAWQEWGSGGYDIYCARISREGTLLDTAGVAVCTATGDQMAPALAYNGTDYLVSWQGPGTAGRDVYGARVNSQGVVLDPGGFVVSAAPSVQGLPAAAAGSDDFLVVWSDWRNVNREIYGARVTGDGVVLDTAGIRICSAAGSQGSVAVEYDGTDFLAVWPDQRGGEQDIYGARVSPQGSVLDTFAVTTQQGDQFDPVLARGPDSDMLLVYSGWTGVVQEEPYNSQRIWGTLSPHVGTNEQPTDVARAPRYAPTIIRNVLFLPEASSHKLHAASRLLDAAGRDVMVLRSGPNDVRTLPAGVYFYHLGDARPRRVVIAR